MHLGVTVRAPGTHSPLLENVLAKVDHPEVQIRAQEVLYELDKNEDQIMKVTRFLSKLRPTNGELALHRVVLELLAADHADKFALDGKPRFLQPSDEFRVNRWNIEHRSRRAQLP